MTTFFTIHGRVTEGLRIGRELGFPTANIELKESGAKFGVYACRVTFDSNSYFGILSIGVKPTIGDGFKPAAECHIFDFSGDIYNRDIEIKVLDFIREERKFDSLDQLKEQIHSDVEKTQQLIKNYKTL